jgi:hypothetical protein
MRKIVKAIPQEDYRMEIWFDDGDRVAVDLRPLMNRRIFKPLWDRCFFRQVELDEFGGLEWPNGADICVDWVEAEIDRQRPRVKSA